MQQQKYSDQELVDKVINKEMALFELIIRRNNRYIYRIGKMYRFSHEDIQDLMQDTYVDAFAHLHQFESRSSFRTWISKIMYNKCFRMTKKWESKNMESLQNHTENLENIQDKTTSNTVMNNEINSVIEESLLNIPLDYRSVFILREINGLSVVETADILVITEGNVKVRLNRAKTFLRAEVEKFYTKEDIFEFNLIYCDAMVNRVMKQINLLEAK
ncbi:sigma-70 family RNA polymerase sigma factor [Halpernia sp. GG3]